MPAENENIEYDVEALAREVTVGLFPSEGETASEEVAEPKDPNPAALPENASDDPPPGTAAFDAMPKAWKKEMEAHWTKLDPEVRKYVNTREADVSRGIQMYQQGHSSWNKLLEPYQQIFQAYPNLDPIQLMHGVLNQHLQLAQASPEQKRELAARMLKAYGLDFPAAQQIEPPQTNAELEALKQRLGQVEGMWQAAQRAAQQTSYQKSLEEVNAFSSDPKNAFWDEVSEDIFVLLKKGAASTLPEAYELACLRNPQVRAKMLQTASASAVPAAPPKSNFPNINGNTVAPRSKKMTMDETISSVISKHYSPH